MGQKYTWHFFWPSNLTRPPPHFEKPFQNGRVPIAWLPGGFPFN
jgi:hypothetical protein